MSPAFQVFGKELREMFRDKRVRSSAFFGPMFLIFVIVFLLGSVISGLGKREGQRIHIVQTKDPLVSQMKAAKMTVIPVADLATGRKLIAEGRARVVLVVDRTSASQAQVKAYFDPKEQLGQVAVGAVQGLIGEQNRLALLSTLAKKGIPASVAEPVKLVREEVPVGTKGAGDFLVSMLPYLIVIWAFYGGFSIVSDLVAGEKEKYTLETLLITPVSRTEIVLGKFMALSVVCLLSSLSSVVGIALAGVLHLPGSDVLFKNGTGVTPASFALILAVLIPAVAFFASLLLAVSTYAKNSREAQTHLTLVSFVVIMPAIFSQFIGLTDAASAMWVNFVPVLNTANNIRTALMGKPDVAAVGITIAMSAILAAIGIAVVVKLFNREQVLTRI